MSEDKLTAVERLEELLNERDERIAELEAEAEAKKLVEDWAWVRHTQPAETDLPVPRLEMRWTQRDQWNWVARYGLVYRHFLGHLVHVPFGETTRNGSGARSPITEGKVDTPFRDGAHIACDAARLKLPAFAICGDVVTCIEPQDRGR